MAEIFTDQLVAGLEVGADVMNPNGQLLFRQGISLTDRHIQVLKTWGIRSIQIAGDEEEIAQNLGVEAVPQELYSKHAELVDNRFQYSDLEFPPIRIVREYCIMRSIEAERRSA